MKSYIAMSVVGALMPVIALAAPLVFKTTPVGLVPSACAPTVPSGSRVEPRTTVCPEAQTVEARLVRYYPPTDLDTWMAFTYAENYTPAFTGRLRGCWVVPFPSGYADGTTHEFPAFQSIVPSAEQPNVEIMVLQPVCSQKGFDTVCASWRCNSGTDCPNSRPIWAYAGDTVCGSIEPAECNLVTGVCRTWTIITWNVTRSESTILSTGVAGQRFPLAFGAVLEPRGLHYCSSLPKGGKLTMTNVEMTSYANIPTVIPGAGMVGAPHGDRIYPSWHGAITSGTPCNFTATIPSPGTHVLTWSSSP